MTGWEVWESLGRLSRPASGVVGESATVWMVKIVLLACALGLLGRALLALCSGIARGRVQRTFGECGVPVVLALTALVLVVLPDGGRVDRCLAHLHWHIQVRGGVAPHPAHIACSVTGEGICRM